MSATISDVEASARRLHNKLDAENDEIEAHSLPASRVETPCQLLAGEIDSVTANCQLLFPCAFSYKVPNLLPQNGDIFDENRDLLVGIKNLRRKALRLLLQEGCPKKQQRQPIVPLASASLPQWFGITCFRAHLSSCLVYRDSYIETSA
eukprot:m.170988 g.170988  ORF g.170988 m.170988 type:complete len:149 (+) comp14804_c0_seq1:419-865(+)